MVVLATCDEVKMGLCSNPFYLLLKKRLVHGHISRPNVSLPALFGTKEWVSLVYYLEIHFLMGQDT